MGEKVLQDDLKLLKSMRSLARQSGENSPGPYWEKTAKAAIREIRNNGLANFRSYSSNIGQSYADAPIVDVRPNLLGAVRKLFRYLFTHISPFKNIFNGQVNLTKSIYKILLEKESHFLKNSDRIGEALNKLKLPAETTLGNCVAVTDIDGKSISNFYLENLSIIHSVNQEIGYEEVFSFMEIGAGFGVNIHLLVENFPNIKKFLIVDICPTLYVSTQYLRAFYGERVVDCVEFQSRKEKRFSQDLELEILCLLPSQLKDFLGEIDFAYNAHSFVEMTAEIVGRYGEAIERLQHGSSSKKLALCTYQAINTAVTVDSDELPRLLKRNLRKVFDTWPRDGYNRNTLYFSEQKQNGRSKGH